MQFSFWGGWGLGSNHEVISIYTINMSVLLHNETPIHKTSNNVGLVLVKLYDILSNYSVFFGNFN